MLYAKWLLEDATARVRYQHEYALGGFRALILINGGAIIGLLTYAGNSLTRHVAGQLGAAFLWYVAGLASTTIAYVFAYFSQGSFLGTVSLQAVSYLGLAADPETDQKAAAKGMRHGFLWIAGAVVLTVVGLAGFLAGSIAAMNALS